MEEQIGASPVHRQVTQFIHDHKVDSAQVGQHFAKVVRDVGSNEFVHRLPGGMHYPNLLLSRGLTDEDALLKWFVATQTKPDLKEMTLTLKGGDIERNWTFADAFPVRWTGPQLDASGESVATETLEIAHTGMKVPA